MSSEPKKTMKASSMDVYSLVCGRDIWMAEKTYPLFLRATNWQKAIRVILDGSVTEDDKNALRVACEGRVEFIDRDDRQIESRLSGFKILVEYRRSEPFALKLVDLALHAENQAVFFFDPDVVHFRPVSILEADSHPPEAVFMEDVDHYVSIGMKALIWGGERVAGRVNSGYFSLPPRAMHLDEFEAFLMRPEYGTLPRLREQTFWAKHLIEMGGCQWDKRYVSVVDPRKGDGGYKELCVGHFTSPSRRMVPDACRYADEQLSVWTDGPVAVPKKATKCISTFDALAFAIRRRLGGMAHNVNL